MYLNFFNLTREPFNITPDPALLYLSPSHKEALAAAVYGVAERKGFISITGEVGVGKTTILRTFLEKLDRDRLKIIHLFNPDISFDHLLKLFFRDLALTPSSSDSSDLVSQLHHELVELYRRGLNVVLIIDEAQNMPVDTLRQLHMLSNLETARAKLVQIILSGQPELEEKLDSAPLRQIRQRLAIRARIRPLTDQESKEYVRHRVRTVSRDPRELFSPAALRVIASAASGIPRVINTLCDNCLITSFAKQEKTVSFRIARQTVREFCGNRESRTTRWAIPALGSLVVVGVAISFSLQRPSSLPVTAAPVSPQAPSVARPDAPPVPVVNTEAAAETKPEKARRVTAAVRKQRVRTEGKAKVIQVRQRGTIPVHRVVLKGDTLPGLVLENYGAINEDLLNIVKRNNPHIADLDNLKEGDRLFFPSRR